MKLSPQKLGQQIQQARKTRQLSQKQLADMAGIGKTAMFDLEHGNPGVRLNTLLAVLENLALTLELVLPEKETVPETQPALPVTPDAPAPSPQENLPDHLL